MKQETKLMLCEERDERCHEKTLVIFLQAFFTLGATSQDLTDSKFQKDFHTPHFTLFVNRNRADGECADLMEYTVHDLFPSRQKNHWG